MIEKFMLEIIGDGIYQKIYNILMIIIFGGFAVRATLDLLRIENASVLINYVTAVGLAVGFLWIVYRVVWYFVK